MGFSQTVFVESGRLVLERGREFSSVNSTDHEAGGLRQGGGFRGSIMAGGELLQKAGDLFERESRLIRLPSRGKVILVGTLTEIWMPQRRLADSISRILPGGLPGGLRRPRKVFRREHPLSASVEGGSSG